MKRPPLPARTAEGTDGGRVHPLPRPGLVLGDLATQGLRTAGAAMRRDPGPSTAAWHRSLRIVQAEVRFLRPVVEPGWNDRLRDLLREANRLLTERAVLDDLLAVPHADRAVVLALAERRLAAGAAFGALRAGDEWQATAARLVDGRWPRRAGRFRLDDPAADVLPGQLRPLHRKLARLAAGHPVVGGAPAGTTTLPADPASAAAFGRPAGPVGHPVAPGACARFHDDLDLRLAAKTAHRLAAGFAMLARAGVPAAEAPARRAELLVGALAEPVRHSRAVELLVSMGLDPAPALAVGTARPQWRDDVDRLLAGRDLVATPAGARPVGAAGGVVWRRDGRRIEIVLVEQHRRAGWTLPKGKQAVGESAVECARREVLEETGLRCDLGAELPVVTYRDRAGRTKQLRFWSMTPCSGELAAGHDVRAVAWFDAAAALDVVTRGRDRRVISSLLRRVEVAA